MDRVIIKDLVARGIIGLNDWEREKPQEILINAVIFTDISKAARDDEIEYSVNYRTLAKKMLAHAETAEKLTVESLAEDLAQICLADQNVLKVMIRVEKPGAVRFANSVGVEIERSKSKYA